MDKMGNSILKSNDSEMVLAGKQLNTSSQYNGVSGC